GRGSTMEQIVSVTKHQAYPPVAYQRPVKILGKSGRPGNHYFHAGKTINSTKHFGKYARDFMFPATGQQGNHRQINRLAGHRLSIRYSGAVAYRNGVTQKVANVDRSPPPGAIKIHIEGKYAEHADQH